MKLFLKKERGVMRDGHMIFLLGIGPKREPGRQIAGPGFAPNIPGGTMAVVQ